MDLSLFFAGTAGSVPTARRGLPAVLLSRGGDRVLFDCGEGTQRQLIRSVGLADITDVFLTHLHADHWLGLPGMLKSFDLRDRERPLTVFGPKGVREALGAMRIVYGRTRYPLSIIELEPGESVERDGYFVEAVPVRHRGPAYGYAVVEHVRPGRFDADLAQRLGVAFGPDFGRLQRGESVNGVTAEQVIGPERPGRTIVLSGDTRPCDAIAAAAHGAERAAETGHSTAAQAAALARDAQVKMLALTHLSTRYAGGELREQAREVFAGAEVPRDFDSIEVPFAEKGGPELVRFEPRRRAAEAPAPGAG